ncbi:MULTISPECIES: restriction endonuclease subunit S [unclassified Colwellia]|uniref:restriction endonuclease subunit S n=1 Tax=unclassified Colwellia TaxID=196834 RepID=UPI0015F5B914|nr:MULTISPECIES: restriction endonuclease subunit S [unclassified Colwellia]MBA6257453.1 restriction endonuclease subunit S [Colwellia sp. MB3u-28]MBA6260525.1 restriction endonuclease subunit S [Colwellia sp. MB3u-41]
MTDVNKLITNNIDVWTSAIKKRNATGRGSSKKIELTGVKKLRELILELAVRGKLVSQDANDEPANILLEKITEEKAQLIVDKKIKKQKPLPAITDAEKPFELPNGWEWARLPNTAYYSPGKTPSTKNSEYWGDDVNNDISWVSIADMHHYRVVESTAKRVTKKAVEEAFKREPVKAGTIIMSFKLTVGKISMLGLDAYHNEAIISVVPYSGVSKEYIYRFLPSRALSGNTKKAIMGNTLNSESLALITIPIPPLAEQHRIVAKVDELMALCDQLEQQTEESFSAHQTLVEVLLAGLTNCDSADDFLTSWQRIAEHFDVLFTTEHSIEQLKQTILQLAVMGKLVPQNPSDEPASVLLEKIAEEKAQLIADKKIKKQKPLPAITDEEKPFELPRGWELCRLGHLINLVSGQHLKPSEYSEIELEKGVPYITGPAEFGEKHPQYSKYTTERRALAKSGDILITCKGAGLGKLNRANKTIAISRQLMAIQPIFVEIDYIHLLVNSSYDYFQDRGVGIAIPGMSREDVTELILQLPPLAEQHRIVAKVDELMALCEQLKTRLSDAQTIQLNLADAVVENALDNEISNK